MISEYLPEKGEEKIPTIELEGKKTREYVKAINRILPKFYNGVPDKVSSVSSIQ